MSYQVLARKWRPRQFSELVGQQHVKAALANALNANRLHHAYLFTGTRGVGKTTIARIFAKSLNCETGITAEPCGQCSTCVEIDAGNYVDLMEIDAASRTKVEDTRDLLDNVQYAPSRGRYKVYLIDEVHMLSRHSFNALLKTLEEPPPHVKFLLATTDPQKLPVTVLSRCLQFSLKALTVAQIEAHLAQVLTAEGLPFDATALALLAQAAKGSLRDSLSLTDQAIALGNGTVQHSTVSDMLGLLDTSWALQLLLALLAGERQSVQQQLLQLVSEQADYLQVLDDMLRLLHLLALCQFSDSAVQAHPHQAILQQLAKQHSPETIQLFYQLLLSGKKDLPFAPDPIIGLDMALLRALAFVPATLTASALSSPPAASTLTIDPPAAATVGYKTAAATTLNTASANAPALPSDKGVTSQPALQPQPTAKTSASDMKPAIDPVTASIMARRGLVVPDSLNTAPLSGEESNAKKSERRLVPAEAQPPGNEPLTAGSSAHQLLTPPVQAESVLLPPHGDESLSSELAPGSVLASADMTMPQAPSIESEDDNSFEYSDMPPVDEGWWQTQTASEPAHEPVALSDEQRFSIRFAAQVDPWSKQIESLALGGLLRLFLLNSALHRQEGQVCLTVAQHQQHLDTPEFRIKLREALQPLFGQTNQLQLRYAPEVPQAPLAIQQRIEQERKDYVSRLMQQDPSIIELQQRFAAQLQLDTLIVN